MWGVGGIGLNCEVGIIFIGVFGVGVGEFEVFIYYVWFEVDFGVVEVEVGFGIVEDVNFVLGEDVLLVLGLLMRLRI